MSLRSHEECVSLASRWREMGWNYRSIADALGVSTCEAVQLVKEAREGRSRDPEPNEYLIQLEASAQRLKWTRQQEQAANCYKPQPVEVQQFLVEDGIRHRGIGAV